MFLILALPRSRTAWLSRFLTYGDWVCGHDELQYMRSLGDIRTWLSQGKVGTVETNAAPWWRLIPKFMPEGPEGPRIVTVRRPLAEVVQSLRPFGVGGRQVEEHLTRLNRKLDQVEKRLPGVMVVDYESLSQETTCAKLFRFCLPYEHDRERWAGLAKENIQINLDAQVRYCRAFRPQLDKLAAQATQQTFARLTAKVRAFEGLTIQTEPFEVAWADGVLLFNEHLVQTDQHPDDYLRKNIPLLRRLDAAGQLQVVTARANGRMFGYMVTVITPSMDDRNVTCALQTTFFASRDFHGLGLRMQRASVDFLRQRGVDEVAFRARDPKMASLFRRIGAEDFGQMFRLQLRGH